MGEVLENLFDVQGASNLGDISQNSDYLFCPTAGREWLVTCDPDDRQVNWIIHHYHRKLKTRTYGVGIYRAKETPIPILPTFPHFPPQAENRGNEPETPHDPSGITGLAPSHAMFSIPSKNREGRRGMGDPDLPPSRFNSLIFVRRDLLFASPSVARSLIVQCKG